MTAQSLVELTFHELGKSTAVMGLITLSRPDDLNALSREVVDQLRDRVREAAGTPGLRMLSITGAGRAFCAGGDLKSYIELQRDPDGFPQFLDDLHELFDSLGDLPVPVVALVNGVAVGGGLELVLACDFAIASSDAAVGDGHLVYGQMGGGGVLARLPRRIGTAKARELIFSGRILSAPEAERWGLVNRVVAPGELLQAAIGLGFEFSTKSPLAIKKAKQVMTSNEVDGLSLADALELERAVTADYCLHSKDAFEGLLAFSEKRHPEFQGE